MFRTHSRFLILSSIACLFCLFFSTGSGRALAEPPAEELCVIAGSALEQASKLRGLARKRDVPCYVHSREKVKDFLLTTIRTKLPPGKLEMEARAFKAIGMIPESFGYEDGLIDLYMSQIGGYYDPEKNHFVMAGWMPAIFQTTIAVHELTHALQDQYFDLEQFIDHHSGTSDLSMARSALVEGDATAVMIDVARSTMGQRGIAEEKDVNAVMMQNVFGVAFMASMKEIPQSLQNLLIFPYTSGLRFAHALLQDGGYPRIDTAFRNPPNTTEEILHPELYLQHTKSYREVSLEELVEAGGEGFDANAEYQDVLGEFGIVALLGGLSPDKMVAAKAGAGWGGDLLAIFPSTEDRTDRIIWKTVWDTGEDAIEFFEAYSGVWRKRGKLLEESERGVRIQRGRRVVDLRLVDPVSVVFITEVHKAGASESLN